MSKLMTLLVFTLILLQHLYSMYSIPLVYNKHIIISMIYNLLSLSRHALLKFLFVFECSILRDKAA